MAKAKRQPTRRDGLTSPTVALTTAKLTPHVIATPSTATAGSHLARGTDVTCVLPLGGRSGVARSLDAISSNRCPHVFRGTYRTESSPSRLIRAFMRYPQR